MLYLNGMRRAVPILLSAFAAAPLIAQQPPKVEIDNQWVHVLRMTLAPHEKTSIDLPLPTVGVVLGDLNQNGTPRKDGDVYYLTGKTTQTVQNPSDKPVAQILIELKPNAPKSTPVKLDPVKLDAEHHPVVLENDRVRALRTILEPHLKSPRHEHPHYVVVYITDLHTTMTMADGREVDNPRKPGDVAWRDALSHVTENIGAKTAIEIQVEIK